MERNSRRKKKAQAAEGADPSAGIHKDDRDDFSWIREVVRDEFSNLFRNRGK